MGHSRWEIARLSHRLDWPLGPGCLSAVVLDECLHRSRVWLLWRDCCHLQPRPSRGPASALCARVGCFGFGLSYRLLASDFRPGFRVMSRLRPPLRRYSAVCPPASFGRMTGVGPTQLCGLWGHHCARYVVHLGVRCLTGTGLAGAGLAAAW